MPGIPDIRQRLIAASTVPIGTVPIYEAVCRVAEPEDEEGFALVRRLEERLGRGEAAEYELQADIFLSEEALGFLIQGIEKLIQFAIEGLAPENITITDTSGSPIPLAYVIMMGLGDPDSPAPHRLPGSPKPDS